MRHEEAFSWPPRFTVIPPRSTRELFAYSRSDYNNFAQSSSLWSFFIMAAPYVSVFSYIISRLCFHLPLNLFKSLKCERFLSSPKLPSWLWDPPSLLFSGYWGLFSRSEGTGAGGPKLKQLVELFLHSLTFLRGVHRENFTFTFENRIFYNNLLPM